MKFKDPNRHSGGKSSQTKLLSDSTSSTSGNTSSTTSDDVSVQYSSESTPSCGTERSSPYLDVCIDSEDGSEELNTAQVSTIISDYSVSELSHSWSFASLDNRGLAPDHQKIPHPTPRTETASSADQVNLSPTWPNSLVGTSIGPASTEELNPPEDQTSCGTPFEELLRGQRHLAEVGIIAQGQYEVPASAFFPLGAVNAPLSIPWEEDDQCPSDPSPQPPYVVASQNQYEQILSPPQTSLLPLPPPPSHPPPTLLPLSSSEQLSLGSSEVHRYASLADSAGRGPCYNQLRARRGRRGVGTLRSVTTYSAIKTLRPHNLFLCSFLSVVLSVLATACLVLNLLQNSDTPQNIPWEEQVQKEGIYEACVPCLSLQNSSETTPEEAPYIQALFHKVTDRDTHLCCARNNGQMRALLHLMTRQQRELIELERKVLANPELALRSRVPPNIHFTPVSAHIRLLPFEESDMNTPTYEGEYTQLRFHLERLNTPEHARNVSLTKNRVTINFSGWYYIYSSVRFSPNKGYTCQSGSYKPWAQLVRRYQNEKKVHETILKATTQCCDGCSSHDTTTYTGGVFRLDRLDQLFVLATGRGLAIDDREAAFFGIVMLGSAGGGEGQLTEKLVQKSLKAAG